MKPEYKVLWFHRLSDIRAVSSPVLWRTYREATDRNASVQEQSPRRAEALTIMSGAPKLMTAIYERFPAPGS